MANTAISIFPRFAHAWLNRYEASAPIAKLRKEESFRRSDLPAKKKIARVTAAQLGKEGQTFISHFRTK
jgi:hypothetical protein